MSRAHWAIPFLLVAVSGCATAPTTLEQGKAVEGPEKPAETKVVEAAEAKPVKSKSVKSKTVKPKADKKTAKKKNAPKKSDVAKVDPKKKAAPKKAVKVKKPEPEAPKVALVKSQPAELPPSVFEDASALVPAQPEIVTLSPVQGSNTWSSTVDRSAAGNPSYTLASLTDPSIIESPASRPVENILPQAQLPQSIAPLTAVGPSAMNFLTKLEQTGEAPEGSYGFILIDAQSGQTLNETNADTPLTPASIAKLLAAVAIMDTKGLHATFRTSLLADGEISGGVLNGDLHLVGTGDPSLNRSDLNSLASRLAATGLRQVKGKFYYHGDALPEVSLIDRGQPAGALYNPGISGLNLDHNEHRGTSPVKNPAKYTADAMRRAAQSAGVILPGPTKGQGGGRGNEIAAHDSAPVSAILTEMFDISRNMTAEVLGAVAATEIGGKQSSLREAAATNASWAQSTIGSIGGSEWAGFNFPNNSGLTTRARATPRQMAALIRHGYQQHGQEFTRVYEEQSSGSSNGVDYAIRAKIGTMSYVRGLGGVISLNERDLIFAIMAMDPARSTRDAKAWMGKARRLEQALMSDWLKNFWPSRQQQVASN